ncbi:MAG: DUF1294 domain-containing protein [Bacilli bacterium]|nr:DUF1294 domain-containing protein [Bacilli bacterium]
MNFTNYLISINIITFIICFIDKQKAIYHKWRISEQALLVLSLIGGCFGMLLSMYLFHHKTKKLKFKLIPIICIIWLIIIFNL